jgi:outer membrane lipase/esterase
MYYSGGFPCPFGMRGKVFAVSSLVLILPVFAALADPLSQVNNIVAFGDSLTDNGNASIVTAGIEPGAGYYYRSLDGIPFQVGEFTNPPFAGGPTGVWIDQFGQKTGFSGVDPAGALGAGQNFAFASALTGSNPQFPLLPIPYVSNQVDLYLAGRSSIPSSNLYSFWAGANDIIAGNNPVTAADNLEANIATLAGDGGKYFLWFNLPLLGNTPRGEASGQSAALNTASAAFDGEWAKDIAALDNEFPGIVVVGVDIEMLFNNILNTPGHDGFNVGSTPPGANPNDYLFTFDGLHPTSAADALIADLALTDLQAVPEPAAAALALLGLCAFVASAKLKAKYRG